MSIDDKIIKVMSEDRTIFLEIFNGVDKKTAFKRELKRIDEAISTLKDYRKGFVGKAKKVY